MHLRLTGGLVFILLVPANIEVTKLIRKLGQLFGLLTFSKAQAVCIRLVLMTNLLQAACALENVKIEELFPGAS
jgi:hypothetical protein